MSITDELREYAHDCCARVDDAIHDIADRIDAEHEAKVSYWQGASYKDGYDEGFASADDWLAQNEDAMAEHGWIRLPVDADGEYIRVGDVVEWCDNGETLTVEGVGNDVLFYIDGENAEWTAARNKRHHHAPTVEDVLRDVVTLCHNTWKEGSGFEFYDVDNVMKSGNIAEFAAKLRLAKEDA